MLYNSHETPKNGVYITHDGTPSARLTPGDSLNLSAAADKKEHAKIYLIIVNT